MTKSLLSVFDVTDSQIGAILKTARDLKTGRIKGSPLKGRTLGLILEKPSTRTTVSFAVAIYQLGGLPLILDAANLQRKRGEPISDTARTLSRYVDGIMIRAFHHEDVEEFARWAAVPVINGLTDMEHPCQVFGDILTIMEQRNIKTREALKKISVVFVGDGNNVANSWFAAAALMGFSCTLACPKGYEPDAGVMEKAREAAARTGARLSIVNDAARAVRNADVIYTDVWTSMGEESEQDERRIDFRPYQVNAELVAEAPAGVMVMHCLPAIRGEEITDDVFEGPRSVIFDQAENRLHIQKSVLIHFLSGTRKK